MVPNLGVTLRNRLIERRAALETGEQLSISSGLGNYIAAAWEDLKLIGSAFLGGATSVDTDSLLGMTGTITSSLGTIMDSVQAYTNGLATLRDDYMAGVGSDQLNSAINNIYNTTNEGVEKTEQLTNKVAEIVTEREQTDKTEASKKVDISNKSLDELVKETMNGVYGNGQDRKNALGDRYDEVQAAINKQLYGDGSKKETSGTNNNSGTNTNKTNTTTSKIGNMKLTSKQLENVQSIYDDYKGMKDVVGNVPDKGCYIVKVDKNGKLVDYYAYVETYDDETGNMKITEFDPTKSKSSGTTKTVNFYNDVKSTKDYSYKVLDYSKMKNHKVVVSSGLSSGEYNTLQSQVKASNNISQVPAKGYTLVKYYPGASKNDKPTLANYKAVVQSVDQANGTFTVQEYVNGNKTQTKVLPYSLYLTKNGYMTDGTEICSYAYYDLSKTSTTTHGGGGGKFDNTSSTKKYSRGGEGQYRGKK